MIQKPSTVATTGIPMLAYVAVTCCQPPVRLTVSGVPVGKFDARSATETWRPALPRSQKSTVS